MQPENRNITYYQGDDVTLIVFPKNSDGNSVNLEGTKPFFHIADVRGDGWTVQVPAEATVENVNEQGWGIVVGISSLDGQLIKNGYMYDIGYYTTSNKKITVLTGSFNVILDVRGIDPV